jgi:hypothetical protein
MPSADWSRVARGCYETLTIPGRADRVRIAYGIIGRGVVAQLGYSMENDTAFIGIFKKIFLIAMSALILTAVMVGWFMATAGPVRGRSGDPHGAPDFRIRPWSAGADHGAGTKRSTGWH